MKVIIPVAGVGERLRPFTHTTPKPLLSIAGKPIIAHIVDRLIDFGADELIFVVGYMSEKIEQYIRSRYKGYNLNLNFVHQEELLGLGYAVSLALQFVEDDTPVLIILGDTIVEADITKITSSKVNLVGLTWVENPQRFGVVELIENKVVSMEEKPSRPKSNWAIGGVYFIVNSSALKQELDFLVSNDIRTNNEIQLTDALARMLAKGYEFGSFVIDGWYDCGKPETLLETHKHLLDKNGNTLNLEGNIIIPPVHIDPSAKISNSIIGPYVSIGEGAVIQNAILRNSIVGDEAMLKNCILEDSILGNDSSFWGKPHRLNLGDSSKVELEWE